MERNEAELRRVAAELYLSHEQARFCDPISTLSVVDKGKRAFVRDEDPRWWWASLKVPATRLELRDSKGFLLVTEHVPRGETRCWLIAENDDDGPWHVLDVVVEVVLRLLAECSFFEYYLIGQAFDWLVCENHHNEIVVSSVIEG